MYNTTNCSYDPKNNDVWLWGEKVHISLGNKAVTYLVDGSTKILDAWNGDIKICVCRNNRTQTVQGKDSLAFLPTFDQSIEISQNGIVWNFKANDVAVSPLIHETAEHGVIWAYETKKQKEIWHTTIKAQPRRSI